MLDAFALEQRSNLHSSTMNDVDVAGLFFILGSTCKSIDLMIKCSVEQAKWTFEYLWK